MRILSTVLLILSPVSLFAGPAKTLPLTYEAFEVSVPHMDLENCPEGLDGSDRFCRATLASDQIHVFVFSELEDSPLIAFESYDASLIAGLLQ